MKFARMAAAVDHDEAYFVSAGDARSAAAAFLSRPDPPPEVGDRRVASDWGYAGTTHLDEQGEYYDQTRVRGVVSLEAVGAETTVAGSAQNERRRIRPTLEASPWTSWAGPLDLSPLRATMQRLEDGHLATVRSGDAPERLLGEFARMTPAGFSIVRQDESSVSVERTTTTRKDRERKGLWATWEARVTLTARVDEQTGRVVVESRLDHRFSTESAEGAWETAPEQNPAPALDWLADTLRAALPAGEARYGGELLASVAQRNEPIADPPTPPPLRTMAQIETIITRRAFEQARGDFTVCVDHILVNPKGPGGYDWDVPGASLVLDAVEAGADGATGAFGELNAVADRQPLVAAAADGGMAWLTNGTIDRRQAESMARITVKVAGWTSRQLPTQPDVAGSVVIGERVFPLPETENAFRVDPGVCSDVHMAPGAPVASVSLWDVDLQYNDAIGTCTLSSADVLDRGLTGVGCGYARVYTSARFKFSFAAIREIGLPPAE